MEVSYDDEVEKLKKMSQEISVKVANLKENIISISTMIESDPIENTNCTMWKRKLGNIKTSPSELISYLDKAYQYRLQEIKYKKQKEELFQHAKGKKAYGEDGIKIVIEDNESLSRSHSKVSEMVTQGYETLHSLQRQHDVLKKIQKRAYTILSDLGVSNSLAKVIERRSRNDFYIMICLFLLLLVIVFVLYFYVRPMIWG